MPAAITCPEETSVREYLGTGGARGDRTADPGAGKKSEASRPCLPTGRHKAELPGNVDMITGSAFLPAPDYRQEGGASSRLARKNVK